MTDTITVPLNKLLAWEGNVRKTDPDKGIDELAASIAAHGLLQSLVVRKDKRGKYAVVAGRRRLLALEALAEAGAAAKEMPVPCTVISDSADAAEIGLAENVQREAMHPADEFEAFKALIDGGMPPADVAARFGVTETVVQKRLKLARVSPVLLKAYRNGELSLQHVMAFAVTDDHEAQERVWKELPDWQTEDPDAIREMLTEHEITAQDRRVKFVTLKAYEKAGGTVRRDLFSEGDDGIFIDDVVLLERLVAAKLEKAATAVRKEGWKWVEIRTAFDHDEWSDCGRRFPELAPLSPEQQQEMDNLVKESEMLSELDELDDDQQARLDAIEERLDELDNRETVWSPETLAIAGAVVTLGRDGKAAIHCGYVKPEDAPPKPRKGKTVTLPDGTVIEAARDPHSAALIENLTTQRSAAISAVLLENPAVALAATVHALAARVFYNCKSEDLALQIAVRPVSLRKAEGSSATLLLGNARDYWDERLPGTPDELFDWCMNQDDETLRRILAFCVAQTVNGVRFKADRPDSDRLANAADIAKALKLDMTAWFTPTAANYFGSVSKAVILGTLREVKGDIAPAWNGLKRAELAALAERQVAGSGWLPEPLRLPSEISASAEAAD
ncbi:MAG TPA: ParB/RepB/Spo0J family partition protein [Bryobacteraceae bacterium]|nr:ParB/RepB/Spo0J family partition protein [Bryobacteraceae bacterium]